MRDSTSILTGRKAVSAMVQNSSTVLSASADANHTWIATELRKGMDAERACCSEAKARGESPPDPSLGVLYHEISAADERHAAVIERVATRYGHTPGSPSSSGISEALGQIKDRFANLGSSPVDLLSADLQAKARSVHWLTAWAQALQTIGDSASAGELSAVLKEERAHQDALQQGFNRMIAQLARRGSVEVSE